jgi:hypothetical protein
MNAIAQWSENTRATVMRAGVAGFAALILILLFGIYIYFFPTPLSPVPAVFERFTGNAIATPQTRQNSLHQQRNSA